MVLVICGCGPSTKPNAGSYKTSAASALACFSSSPATRAASASETSVSNRPASTHHASEVATMYPEEVHLSKTNPSPIRKR